MQPVIYAMITVLVSLVLLAPVSCHPGTWDGKVIMNENGAELPDLSGEWTDATENFELRIYQPSDEVAAAPNSSYARMAPGGEILELCKLTPIYSYQTRHRIKTIIRCDGQGHSREGLVEGEHGEQVTWPRPSEPNGKWSWQKKIGSTSHRHFAKPKIHKVHVVFMNHYDVGYTDFINGVDNTYMHKYFPLARATAEKMRASGLGNFTYTTHPWLMQRFLECPCADDASGSCLARNLNNTFEAALKCPSEEELKNFSAAAKLGEIVWNAAPFNIQPENLSPELLHAAFDLTRRLDRRFGRPDTRTMSIRDAMYVTRSVLPHLTHYNITGLTIGSNGADFPPQVPKLHRWIDYATNTDIVVAYHPYGYGGYGLKDCAEAPNGVALCTEFRTDNTGPPANISEVMGILNSVKKEYPGAEVLASTFDAFFEEIQEVREKLPIVSLEVGDTWVYGNPSDPLKMAQYRAIQRAWLKCTSERCQGNDPAIQNMTFFLLKAPEHTWGTPGISGWGGGDDYNTSKFRQDLQNQSFMKAAESWAEQRIFNELAVLALEETNHPLAPLVREELKIIEDVQEPSFDELAELQELPLTGSDAELPMVTFSSGTQIRLGFDGSIVMLRFPGGENLASSFGSFSYQTFNDTEWKPFTYAYLNDHQMQTGFCKPGSNNFTESATWRPTLQRLFIQNGTSEFILAQLQMPTASLIYGAPSRIYFNISQSKASKSLDLSYTTIGKQPTMIGESSSISFLPRSLAGLAASAASGSPWRLMKLGHEIDPEGVLDGGNQFVHAVWGGFSVKTAQGVLSVDSLDAMNVNPITSEFPVGNPLPASYIESTARAGKGLNRLPAGSIKGMAVNLHNNLWNTNYPLYYPYYDSRFCETPLTCKNSNSLFRFHLEYTGTQIYI